MAALAAEGRTADALRVFDDFRRVLGDELGIEPSPALAAQHAALLEGIVGLRPGRPPQPAAGRRDVAWSGATTSSAMRSPLVDGATVS